MVFFPALHSLNYCVDEVDVASPGRDWAAERVFGPALAVAPAAAAPARLVGRVGLELEAAKLAVGGW